MKHFLWICLTLGFAISVGCSKPASTRPFPTVRPDHSHVQALLENAMAYTDPVHGLTDPVSGYPVEGWNQDPEQGLFLRSFTQLTSIGAWLELLANEAAGYVDSPYRSRDQALEQLEQAVRSLREDQQNPRVSAKGLLGNFLGLEGGQRIGPLASSVELEKFKAAFGEPKAGAIWQALADMEWIKPAADNQKAAIERVKGYGSEGFTDALSPYADPATINQVMALLDQRVVQIIFGDNANLSASAAKTIGALLHPDLAGNPSASMLREELEQFLDAQEEGYRHLYDRETSTFVFGWNATRDQFFGWDDGTGKWIVGHMNYFINEFRGPLMWVVLRYGLSENAVRNAGMKIKSYRTADGRDLYTPASWDGSAFQSFGLSLFMQEQRNPGWRAALQHAVDVGLDFSTRHQLPGLLSESYSGEGTEYTGKVGIPELAVTAEERITDAPSLYTLGVAYQLAPDKVEAFLASRWDGVRRLFTGHGPWEGTNISRNEVIRYQTSAHTLSLLLGALGTAPENMRRYLASRGLLEQLESWYHPGEALDFLSDAVTITAWSPGGHPLKFTRTRRAIRLEHAAGHEVGLTLTMPKDTSLSNGKLRIAYRSKEPVARAVLTLNRAKEFGLAPMDFPNEITLRLDQTGEGSRTIEVPLPATPGLKPMQEAVLLLGARGQMMPVDLTFTGFSFMPYAAAFDAE